MSNYLYSSNAVDSLIAYINDVKPYHSKLTEIVEEYQFYETMGVSIGDNTHFTKTKIAGIWDTESYSNGLFAQQINLPFFKQTKSSKNWNNALRIVPSQNDSQLPGVTSAYYLKHNTGVRQVTRNKLSQIEGVDFHISHGAHTLQVDGANTSCVETPFANIVGDDSAKWVKGLQLISEETTLQYGETSSENAIVTNIVPNLNADAYEEWTLECVQTVPNTRVIFSVTGSETGLIGYAFPGTVFNSFNISFLIKKKPDSVSFTLGEKLVLTPSNKIVTHKSYNQNEKWSLIKVNPIAYLRPKFIKTSSPKISNFTIKTGAIRPQVVKLTFNGSVFVITNSFGESIGSVANGSTFSNTEYTFHVLADNILPASGDYFEINISNPGPVIKNLDISAGYDVQAYDDTEFDDRLVNFDFSSINLVVTNPKIVSCYFELTFNGTEFTVTKFNNSTSKLVLDTFPNIVPGEQYSNDDFSCVIPTSSQFLNEDSIIFNVVNVNPSIGANDVYLVSTRFGTINLYPKSFIDTPAQLWTVEIVDSTTFTVTGSVTGATEDGVISRSYDNGLIHFTLFQSSVPFEAGDKFVIQTLNEKPSYLVHNENTGFSKPLTVGKWYWNGQIGLKIDAPVYQVEAYVPNASVTKTVKTFTSGSAVIDSDGRTITFNRAPRFDAKSDVYYCDLLQAEYNGHQFFNVSSAISGVQRGAKVNERYISEIRPELSFGSDFEHNDSIVDFTISDGGQKFTNAKRIKFEILADQKFNLFHANDLIIFDSDLAQNDYVLVDRTTNDKIYFQTNSDNPIFGGAVLTDASTGSPTSITDAMAYTGLPAVDAYGWTNAEVFDGLPALDSKGWSAAAFDLNYSAYTNSSSTSQGSTTSTAASSNIWLPTFNLPVRNFSDENSEIGVYLSTISKKIGTIKNIGGSSRQYQFIVDDAFFSEFLPFNTTLSTRVVQNEQENAIVKARITEKMKVFDFFKLKDSFGVSVSDEIRVTIDAHSPAFTDLVNVVVDDVYFKGFFSGYDTVEYDYDPAGYLDPVDYLDPRAVNYLQANDAYGWKNANVNDGFPAIDSQGWNEGMFDVQYSETLVDSASKVPGYDENEPIQLGSFGPSAGGIGYFIKESSKANQYPARSSVSEVVSIYSKLVDDAVGYVDPSATTGLDVTDGFSWTNANVNDGFPAVDSEGWDEGSFNVVYGMVTETLDINPYELTVNISSLSIPKPGSVLSTTPYANVPSALVSVNRTIGSVTIMKRGISATSVVMFSNIGTQTQVPVVITESTDDFIKIALTTPSIGSLVIF